MNLGSVNTIESYLAKVASRSRRGLSTWYRGQLDKFGLQPSLYRNAALTRFEHALEKEWDLRDDFAEMASVYYTNGVEPGIQGLMQMQHYRVPTRLLDWSRNPLIGLFFALTESQATNYGDDGAVWLLDPDAWNKKALARVSGKGRPLGISDPEMLSYVGVDRATVLSGENPVTIRGHTDNSRIAAQQGAFVILGNSGATLEKMDEAAARMRVGKDVLGKLVIPVSHAPKMLENLLAMGITDDFVYPDLDGVVSHIRRRAGYSR